MAFTKTSIAAGGIDKTVGVAIAAFAQVNVMLPLVTVQSLPIGSNVAQWSDETNIGSSSVDALTEGGDQTTVVSMTSAARTATLAEHVIRADLGDLVSVAPCLRRIRRPFVLGRQRRIIDRPVGSIRA